MIDLRKRPTAGGRGPWLGEPLHMRGHGAVARRLTCKLGHMPTVLGEHSDGIALVPGVTASTSLGESPWECCESSVLSQRSSASVARWRAIPAVSVFITLLSTTTWMSSAGRYMLLAV